MRLIKKGINTALIFLRATNFTPSQIKFRAIFISQAAIRDLWIDCNAFSHLCPSEAAATAPLKKLLQRLNRSSLTWEVLRYKVLKSIGHKVQNPHIIILYLICWQPSLLLTMAMPLLRGVRQPLKASAKPAHTLLVLMRMFAFLILAYKKPQTPSALHTYRKGYFIPHSVGSNHSGAQTSLSSQTPRSLQKLSPTQRQPHSSQPTPAFKIRVMRL